MQIEAIFTLSEFLSESYAPIKKVYPPIE